MLASHLALEGSERNDGRRLRGEEYVKRNQKERERERENSPSSPLGSPSSSKNPDPPLPPHRPSVMKAEKGGSGKGVMKDLAKPASFSCRKNTSEVRGRR